MLFPNIDAYLGDESPLPPPEADCRNIAVVLRDIYNVIPAEEVHLRSIYVDRARWLLDSAFYTAPEIFNRVVWFNASQMMQQVFAEYLAPPPDEEPPPPWVLRSMEIFSNK